MICSQAPPVYGGAGAQALALASRLVQRGCEVDLLTENQLFAPRRDRIDGVRVLRSPGEGFARRLPARAAEVTRTLTFTAWLLQRLLRGRYDVYHLHGNYWFGLAPAILSRILHRPLILKVTRLGDDDAATIRAKRLRFVPLGWLYSLPTRWAAFVVALNHEIARRQAQNFPRVATVALANGVDVGRFAVTPGSRTTARAALGLPADAAVVLFVGYVTPRKGVLELLEAWHALASRRDPSERRAFLLLVGPNAGIYRDLDRHAADVALRSSDEGVRWLGHLAVSDMPTLYAAADVLVLPSRSEGMPNCVLEALAAGLSIVATRVPGVVEAVDGDTETILLDQVEADAIRDGLEVAIARAGTDPRAPRVRHEFSLDYVADTYLDMYRFVAATANRGPGANDGNRQKTLEHQC